MYSLNRNDGSEESYGWPRWPSVFIGRREVSMVIRYSSGEFHGSIHHKKQAEELTAVVTECPASPGSPVHSHDASYFAMLVTGHITECVEGRKDRALQPMVMTFHPKGEEHATRETQFGVRSFGVVLNDSFVDRASTITPLLQSRFEVPSSRGRKIATKLLHECVARDEAACLSIESLLYELIDEAARVYPGRPDTRPQRWLRHARELIFEHRFQSTTLASIANEVGIHPIHLAREFQRHYGCTPGEYVRSLRVSAACSMLVRSRQPISSIAVTSGFYDQAHFTRVFKTHVGVTPREYRSKSCVG